MHKEQYQYIWYLIYKNLVEEKDLSMIRYVKSENISPYLEINEEDLNFYLQDVGKYVEIEINPLVRFSHIFHDIIDNNIIEKEDLREKVFNIIAHILANVDLKEGLNKRYLINKLIIRDIDSNRYGEEIKNKFNKISKKEQVILADGIQSKYTFEHEIKIFENTIKKIFSDSIVYDNLEDEKVIVVYINEKKTRENRDKYKMIEMLFLPMGLKSSVFWEYHFGILGVDETMVTGEFSLY